MRESRKSFPWNVFFRRMLGGLIIGGMWVVQDILKRDFTGVTVALLTGIPIAVACYFWVRSDLNVVVENKKTGNQV